VAIWCFVLVTFDGFDNGAINFAAPAILLLGRRMRRVPTPAAAMPAEMR